MFDFGFYGDNLIITKNGSSQQIVLPLAEARRLEDWLVKGRVEYLRAEKDALQAEVERLRAEVAKVKEILKAGDTAAYDLRNDIEQALKEKKDG